ncbi:MAG TPA: energy transducer TonB [Dyella sp.]|nr:energy transducer TonB [Dyella sp.]
MKRWMTGAFCVLWACTTWAGANANSARKLAEASMLVSGWIEVMPDGAVHQYTLDHPEKLPPAVVDLMQKAAPNWKFHLTDGIHAIHRAKMSVRIVAKRVDDTHDSISIASATFGEPNATPTDHVTQKNKPALTFPRDALMEGFGGTVYLVLRVNRQGRVEDAAVEQVNLDEYSDERSMDLARRSFSNAALVGAKRWTFHLPTTGTHVNDPSWQVRVPIHFIAYGARADVTYGTWAAYIPGPHQSIPWLKDESQASQSPDAIPPGSIADAEPSMQLISALGGT